MKKETLRQSYMRGYDDGYSEAYDILFARIDFYKKHGYEKDNILDLIERELFAHKYSSNEKTK